MEDNIMVSVLCATYNQEKYIGQALESFIKQKTNFKFEIIVNDDCSTDNTANVIREYADKYPDLIKPIYQKENQYSKGIDFFVHILFPRANGKYFAICEGDDYWIDEYKLQKQFDYLENHSDYSFCVHNAIKVNLDCKKVGEVFPVKENSELTCEDFILGNGGYIATNSIFSRTKYIKELPELFNDYAIDYMYQIYFSSLGKTYCFSDIMSVYRVNVEGSWTIRHKDNKEKMVKYYDTILKKLEELNKYTNYKYKDAFEYAILKREYYKYFTLRDFKKIKEEKYQKVIRQFSKKERMKLFLKMKSPKLFAFGKKIKRKLKGVIKSE